MPNVAITKAAITEAAVNERKRERWARGLRLRSQIIRVLCHAVALTRKPTSRSSVARSLASSAEGA